MFCCVWLVDVLVDDGTGWQEPEPQGSLLWPEEAAIDPLLSVHYSRVAVNGADQVWTLRAMSVKMVAFTFLVSLVQLVSVSPIVLDMCTEDTARVYPPEPPAPDLVTITMPAEGTYALEGLPTLLCLSSPILPVGHLPVKHWRNEILKRFTKDGVCVFLKGKVWRW